MKQVNTGKMYKMYHLEKSTDYKRLPFKSTASSAASKVDSLCRA